MSIPIENNFRKYINTTILGSLSYPIMLYLIIRLFWLPSLLMPIFMHFLSRQYWHWFLWCWSIGQFRLPLHEYVKFRLTLRLKNDLQPETFQKHLWLSRQKRKCLLVTCIFRQPRIYNTFPCFNAFTIKIVKKERKSTQNIKMYIQPS